MIFDKDLKQLYSKIMTISGYIIAMRSECIREAKKTEDALKILIKRTYDIRGGLWICLITIVKYTELGDKEHKDSSYNQLIISIAFPPDSMYLTIYGF
jgi:hypothetical protein